MGKQRTRRRGVGYLTPAARAYSPALQARLVRELIAPEGAPLVTDLFGTGRPQIAPAANVFCPTGPGGGVDPTCKPGTGGLMAPDSGGGFGGGGQVGPPTFKPGDVGVHPGVGEFKVKSISDFSGHATVELAGGHEGVLFSHELKQATLKPPAPALPDPDKVKVLKTLPGSTQPKLVEDASGKKWVMKAGAGKEPQLRNEAAADAAYRAAGVPVPRGGLVETPGGPVKFTEYHEGVQTLDEWGSGKTAEEKEAVYKQLRQHFVTDALLANWDVVGLTKDNVLITADGKALRADNGGGLLYRAQGSPKGDKFGPNVGELFSLRDPNVNPSAASVFKGVTDKEVTDQIPGVLARRQAILDAVPDAKTKGILSQRFDYLQKLHGQAQAPPASPPPPAPAPKPAAGKAPPKLDSGAALVSHLKENPGGIKFTPLHLKKVAYLNPNGIENGAFLTPETSKEDQQAHLDHLKKILPAGTKIQKVVVKGYHLDPAAAAPKGKAFTEPLKTKTKTTATGEAFGKDIGAAFGESEKGAGVPKFGTGTGEETAADKEHYFEASHGVKFAGKGKGSVAAWYRADDILKAQEKEYWPKLNEGERAAIKSYTSGGYAGLNEEMRSCAPNYDCLGAYNKGRMDNLLSAMDKAPPLSQPVNVRRGISIGQGTADKIVAEAEEIRKSGGTFSLPSFTSTSARKPFGGNFGFDILARTGLYVEGHTSVDGEYELLQSPKAKYKVLGTSKKGGKTILHLEEVA
jgi:hypothetical protein